MDVRNCKGCGKLFNYVGGIPLCPSCIRKLDEKFDTVKEYLYTNPKANLQNIAEDCEVSIQQIKRWVKEERLVFSEDSVIGVECENCGGMIRTGRFCEACKAKMANKLGNLYDKPKEEKKKAEREKERMRFLDS